MMTRIKSSFLVKLLSVLVLAKVSAFQTVPSRTLLLSRGYPTTTTRKEGSKTSVFAGFTCHNRRRRSAAVASTSTSLSAFAAASSVSAVVSAVSSPLASLALLAVVVLVHEAGHFLAARCFGITVDEFSVGVGPRLLGYASSSDEGDSVEYSLRALPFGGYVRFPECYNATEVARAEDEARRARIAEREARNDDDQPTRDRGLLGLLSLVNNNKKEKERQRQRAAAAKEEEERNRTWWWSNLLSKRKTKTNTNAATNIDASGRVVVEYYDDPDLLQNRPWTQRAVVLAGGIVFNLLLAFACYFGEATVGEGLVQPKFDAGAVVHTIRSDGPSYGRLSDGDVIVGFNGQRMILPRTSSPSAAQQGINNFISAIRSTPEGGVMQLTVRPASSKASAAPVYKEISLNPRHTLDLNTGELTGPISLGVTLYPNYLRTDMIKADSVFNGVVLASTQVRDVTVDTVSSTVRTLNAMLFGNSNSGGPAVSGPIGVIRMGAEVVSSSSSNANAVAAFVAAISVNLAVVNALPIPALDGGQLVFVLAEAVSGRQVEQRRQDELNSYAVLLLLAFSVSTVFTDVGDLFK